MPNGIEEEIEEDTGGDHREISVAEFFREEQASPRI